MGTIKLAFVIPFLFLNVDLDKVFVFTYNLLKELETGQSPPKAVSGL